MNYFVITLPEPNAKAWKQLSLEATGSNWKQLEATISHGIPRRHLLSYPNAKEPNAKEPNAGIVGIVGRIY